MKRRQFLNRSAGFAAGIAPLSTARPAPDLAPSQSRSRQWFGPPVWPPFDRVETVLRHWARTHPDRFRLDLAGRSARGTALWTVRLTDPESDPSDKQHALVTALHAGLERSGSNTVLALIEWLLSDDPRAREILRRQEIVCIPIPDPDCYTEGKWTSVYNAWTLDGPRNPERSPEAMAVKTVMDETQPELHADIHGTNLGFARYIMFENSATSYSNTALRPYHRDIPRLMDEAALAEGYPSDTAESDAQRLFWGPAMDQMRSKLWVGRPQIYAALYCYHRYHTLIAASEVGWERSGVVRHRRLLEIGGEVWPGERHCGYPTGIVMANTHTMIAAYGRSATERRRSRVELWNKLPQLTLGFIDPVVEGKAACVCAVTPAARKQLEAPSLAALVQRLRQCPRMDADAIGRFTANWPAGQNGPNAALALQTGSDTTAAAATTDTPIAHGLSLRLRIPYAKARILDLRLNGRPVPASDRDGSTRWTARGCTYVEVNLSPDRLKTDDLFLATCDYDPGERRGHWDTWRHLPAPGAPAGDR